jgi:hypothetical protein
VNRCLYDFKAEIGNRLIKSKGVEGIAAVEDKPGRYGPKV